MTGLTPAAAELVQRAAGVIAAKHRGDLGGAEELLAAFGSEQAKTLGFYLLADLSLGLLRAQSGQSLDDLVRELSLLVAATTTQPDN
ncbi:superoxide dismutase [Verrucosispora sp. WMMA2121]|uniref:superoxide dismutase n=1 Tax=unclassified Micromonospora TaxID=2617518 RepID=UPI0022B6BF26|nr:MULTISPECIES: superoxide dismutase [unclassified Micromonospora]MCZ7418639.1 superoxide dismutase [Verrucosispora sp. WMMA2121]WFE46800.1 superoxide dismutase [Verrucosispora sp. WMMD1129]